MRVPPWIDADDVIQLICKHRQSTSSTGGGTTGEETADGRTKLNGNQNGTVVVQNKTSCSFAFKVTGPITISKGTGAYKGISGTANMTVIFAGVGPYYTSGGKKGQCNTSHNATPSGVYQSITGIGIVKYG